MISIVKSRKIWFLISGVMIGISIVSIIIWNLNFGIDFTGGSLMEISFKESLPKTDEVTKLLTDSGLVKNPSVQLLGDKGMILRFTSVSEEDHQKILTALQDAYKENISEDKFDSIGPTIGEELKQKTFWALILAAIGIILYIAWSFRAVSRPVSSWNYGIIANIALLHDVLIAVGAFSILGKFYGIEINSPFIAALLTIMGYSVNDTIVVFDRIRENLIKSYKGNLGEIIDKSINETIARSINTNTTVLLVLIAIFFFGGSTMRDFTLALIIGVTVGTYSSIFIASPLLIVFDDWSKKRKK